MILFILINVIIVIYGDDECDGRNFTKVLCSCRVTVKRFKNPTCDCSEQIGPLMRGTIHYCKGETENGEIQEFVVCNENIGFVEDQGKCVCSESNYTKGEGPIQLLEYSGVEEGKWVCDGSGPKISATKCISGYDLREKSGICVESFFFSFV
jgi:hypothetical protein